MRSELRVKPRVQGGVVLQGEGDSWERSHDTIPAQPDASN